MDPRFLSHIPLSTPCLGVPACEPFGADIGPRANRRTDNTSPREVPGGSTWIHTHGENSGLDRSEGKFQKCCDQRTQPKKKNSSADVAERQTIEQISPTCLLERKWSSTAHVSHTHTRTIHFDPFGVLI